MIDVNTIITYLHGQPSIGQPNSLVHRQNAGETWDSIQELIFEQVLST
jgi:hypothetical protein